MRVLLLARYAPRAPSSRVRSYQYLRHLEEDGIHVTPAPLLGDGYVRAFYERGVKRRELALAGYLRRAVLLFDRAPDFDLLWLEKELFPWLPPWAEAYLERAGVPFLADYDDAVFHYYDRHRWAPVRRLLGGKIDTVMRRARIVTAGSPYLAERAREAGAERVVMLPSTVDLDRYPRPAAARPRGATGDRCFTVGWIGTPFTARYLPRMREVLARLRRDASVRFVAVGAGRALPEGLDAEAVAWSRGTEASEIAAFDVGVMPVPDTPFERGKCGYKLIQYMACGKPVVASPVGANRELVEEGVNGFLAGSTEAWTEALARLRDDPELRLRMGREGRRRVEERYAVQVQAPRLAGALRDAAG